MGSESKAHEAMRARGIIVLVKSGQLVKRSRQNNFSQLKLDFNPFLPPKSRRFSLLVGYNIQPNSSSTNQNAELMIDHQLDFTNIEQVMFTPYRITLYVATKSCLMQCEHLSDMSLSSLEIGEAHQLPSVTEIAPKSPFLSVNRSPSARYGFCVCAKFIRYSVNTYPVCDSPVQR